MIAGGVPGVAIHGEISDTPLLEAPRDMRNAGTKVGGKAVGLRRWRFARCWHWRRLPALMITTLMSARRSVSACGSLHWGLPSIGQMETTILDTVDDC